MFVVWQLKLSDKSVLCSGKMWLKQSECYTLFEELDQGYIFNNDLGLISRSAMNEWRPENKTKQKKKFSWNICKNMQMNIYSAAV